MKLLFDENLSHKLVHLLAEDYPDSVHVRSVSLGGASDSVIWEYARTQGYIIASKDTDFRERSFVEGFPPKIIWLDVGNTGTQEIAILLRRHKPLVEEFDAQTETSVLIIA